MNVDHVVLLFILLFYCTSFFLVMFIFLLCRSVSPSRSVAQTYVGTGVAWRPVTWMGRKAPWECPRKPPVPASCASSRALSVTSGTACRCVSAVTAVRENLTSPVPLTA